MSKLSVLAIFAHPDDEAFGPGGTLAKWAEAGEVKLICVTDGGAAGGGKELVKTRRMELLASANILGINKVYFLKYLDGSLNNAVYHRVAKDIQAVADQVKPERLITYEPRGISGHLDHIAVSMITSYIFRENKSIKELWYYCQLDRRLMRSFTNHYFIYFPPGYKREEIDEVVNVSGVYAKVVKAIRAHRSQNTDGERIIQARKLLPKEECFLVKKR
jgi:LmbE family N-acetylglucosaminyl deacetylase